MRIGFDAKRLYSNFTGLGNYSRTLVKNLGSVYPENEYYLYSNKISNHPDTGYFLQNPGFISHISTGMLKSFWRSYSIVDQLKKDQIDVFHGLSNELPIPLHKSAIKSVVTIHDLIFRIYPGTYPYIDRRIYDLKFSHSCRHSDRIIAISNSTKNDIVKYYEIDPDKIDVVYQSCNPIYFTRQSEEESKAVLRKLSIPEDYLLSVGSVEERKNLKLIIESYQHLSSGMKIPLVIVGRGKHYRNEVLALIAAKGMEKRIIWIDKLDDNSQLQAIYQNARALIYPSFYEGFGLPVVEALLSKTPVITSDRSSLPEAGGPESLYIDPANPEALAAAIEKVLGNSGQSMTMKEKGHQYAIDNFSPETVTLQLMNTYRKVLNR